VHYKKWIKRSLIILILLLLSNTIFLYLLDTYSIAKPMSKQIYNVPNQRFLIVEYLKTTKSKYDTYIFGSSRVGYINPLKMLNKKAYNLSVGAGIPHEHLLLLRYLLKEKKDIKHILIALDDFSFTIPFSEHYNSLDLKPHYLLTNDTKFSYYSHYFFRSINKIDIKDMRKKYFHKKVPKEIIQIKQAIFFQRLFYENKENNSIKIKINSTNYDKIDTNLPNAITQYIGLNNIENTIQDLKEIILLCKKNNINYKIIINPMSYILFRDINQTLYNQFKKRLSNITDYYDFSNPNPINNDLRYWHEASHYKLLVGDLILKRIYNNDTSIPNFGIHIPQNVYDRPILNLNK